MAVSGLRNLPQEFAIDQELNNGELKVPNHQFNHELRFNFSNKGYNVPKAKLQRYIDRHMAAKSKIPSPDKYINPKDLNFLNLAKKMTIYPYDRQTYI